MEPASVAAKLGLAPGYRFLPEDEEVVSLYLLRRLRGQRLPAGDILEDDPLSAPPWALLQKHGRRREAFFFAAANAKGSRHNKRNCAGGGTWQNQSKSVQGKRRLLPGSGVGEVEWRKNSLSFREERGGGTTGWVMHEYAVTAPPTLAASPLRVYRIRFSGHGKNAPKRKRDAQDWSSDDDEEDDDEDEAPRGTARCGGVEEDTDALLAKSGTVGSPRSVPADPAIGNLSDGADAGEISAASIAMPPDHDLPKLVDDDFFHELFG